MRDYIRALAATRASRPNLDLVEEYGTAVLASVGMIAGLAITLWCWSGRGEWEIAEHAAAVIGIIVSWSMISFVLSGARTKVRRERANEDMERVLFFTAWATVIWMVLFKVVSS